jgi:hypothetical protein
VSEHDIVQAAEIRLRRPATKERFMCRYPVILLLASNIQ